MTTPPTALTLEQEKLDQWVGRCRQSSDHIGLGPANFLHATLNHEYRKYVEGDALPPGWHWLYFLQAPRLDQLGDDGHAALGDFMPPVALPKRMWAGSRLQFHHPLIIGEDITRTSTIESVTRKSGRSGELCFVATRHRFFAGSILKLEEEQNIVYRGNTPPQAPTKPPTPAPQDAEHVVTIQPTSTLLFRYSALTFNGHRIHYDLDYCRQVEGYPALVVHGPLIATLMLEQTRNLDRYNLHRQPGEFSFKALSPLFCDRAFSIHRKETDDDCRIWTSNSDGNLAMSATVSVT